MKRRAFIAALGGATAWPMMARAQLPGKLPTVGFLGSTTPSAESQRVAAFVQRLHQLEWIENRNIVIAYRWAEGRTERFVEIATEFVRLQVDIIVTQGTASTLAAKQATGRWRDLPGSHLGWLHLRTPS
jgi:putative ABC transport system substrate-binding protein